MAAAVTLQALPSQSPVSPPLCFTGASPRVIADLGHLISDTCTSRDLRPTQELGSQCDGCKTRKSRCALNLAAKKCYSCKFHRQDCIFTPTPSRKRPYPHFASHSEGKSSHHQNKSLSSSFQDLLQSPMKCSQGEASNASYASASLAQDASRYLYLRGMLQPDPLLLEHVQFDEESKEASIRSARFRKIGRNPGEFVRILTSDPTSSTKQATITQILNSLPQANTNLLVRKYFEDVHPVFSILDRETFCGSYHHSTVEPLLLVAVCLVSAAWLAKTGGLPKELSLSILDISVYEQLRSALERPSISVLQAGLLLLQDPSQRYQQLSLQVISGAFDLGLHQDGSQWTISQDEKRIRRRLAWALYAQDKWHGLYHGRPAQISGANWMVKPLSTEDFETTSYSEITASPRSRHNATLFMAMTALSQLLAQILDAFYTLSAESDVRAGSGAGLTTVLERAKPIQIRLKNWFSKLPACLRMDAVEEGAGCNGILHLSYFATEVALHHCIVRASAGGFKITASYLTHICRSAAKTRLISAMDFVNRLRPSHFQYAWPFASVSNFGLIGTFGALLQATAPTKEEAAFYHARLNEYKWTMAVSRRKADFLDSAIDLVENSTELLKHAPDKPGIDIFMSTRPPSSPYPSPSTSAASSSCSPSSKHGVSSPHTRSGLSRPFTDPSASSSPDSFLSSDQEGEMIESE